MTLESNLERLKDREYQDLYHCEWDEDKTGIRIGETSITTLIAATGVGKSTITRRIFEIAAEHGIEVCEPGIDTTRPARTDDAANYRTDVSHEEMIERIENREYLNWSIVPSGHIYATPPESITAKHNFLPCLPDSLPMLRRVGFGAVHAFYIVTTAAAWNDQIEDRKGLKDFPYRLEEAMTSLEFAMSNGSLQKIVSQPGEEELTKTAKKILNFGMKSKQFNYNTFNENFFQTESFLKHSQDMYNLAFVLSSKHDKPA